VCVLAALTLLPAVLAVLGRRVDALDLRRWLPGGERKGHESTGLWARLAHWVMRRPVLTLVPILALLLGLGVPFLRVQLGAPDATILPTYVQSRQGYDLLTRYWGQGELSPLLVVLRSTDGTSPIAPDRLANLYDFGRRLEVDERVQRVESVVNMDPRLTLGQYQLTYFGGDQNLDAIGDPFGRFLAQATVRRDVVLLQVQSKYGQTDERSKQLVRDVRATQVPGFEMLVGGVTAGTLDYTDALFEGFPKTAGFVVVAIYLVLLITFRSVLLPIKAILMNTLSITASYGALVVVFQEGFLAGPLNFTPLGFVEASLPIVLFCVLFGLSMDYEVFLLSRIKEAYDNGEDNTTSVAHGLERSGRIITSAAAIVVLVSSSFIVGDIILTKALGLGTALAVFLDATVVRALLVPATMRLLGDWNWWAPAWLQKWLPKGDFHGA
jgi:RND superfamily putative drug exporter